MPTHLARRVAWGLTWRWALLLASLIAPAPSQVIMAIAVLLVIGLVTLVLSRRDLLGSAWRVLLAITVINAGFWMGGAILVPAITLALLITAGDLWWIIAGRAPSVSLPASTALEPVYSTAVQEPPADRRRRASRGTAGGFRLLLTASLLVVILALGAFTLASRAMAGVTTAIASFTSQLAPITGALPAAANPQQALRPTPTPAPSIDVPAPVVIPNDRQVQPPRIDTSGLCLSLPNSRYEIRLPDGQAIVVTTRHRDGCPDLSAILKALQHAGRGDSSSN